MSEVPTKADLEEAYDRVNRLEKKVVDKGFEGRTIFFAGIQADLNDRNPPKFEKGMTMSQAYRLGMDYGVTVTLDNLDQLGEPIVDSKERILNIGKIDGGLDLISLTSAWTDYLNT